MYLQKKPVELRRHFDNIASTLGDWKKVGEAQKLSEEMVEELGTPFYLDRNYALGDEPSGGMISLHLAYYTGMIDAVPHVPDRCLVVAGFNARTQPQNLPLELDRRKWVPDPDHVNLVTEEHYWTVTYRDDVTSRPVTVRMPIGDFKLRTTEFSHDDFGDARIYGGYFFIANGRVAHTPEAVKRIAFRQSEEYAYYCKVQFLTQGDRDMTIDDYVSLSTDLLVELLPEIMHCLPDWADVEARMTETSAESDT